MLMRGTLITVNATLTRGAAQWPQVARCCLAVFVALAVVAASFAITTRATAGAHAQVAATSQLTTSHKQVPAPCQKMLLTGVPSSCSISSLSFNGIAAADAEAISRDVFSATRWPIINFPLPPQCSVLSPYRPPCVGV